jgi:hypothetical protein
MSRENAGLDSRTSSRPPATFCMNAVPGAVEAKRLA